MTEPAGRPGDSAAPPAARTTAGRVAGFVTLVLLALAAGCGLGGDEAHLAPNTPLLPPTSETLQAATALTPTSAAPTTVATVAPTPVPAESEQPAGDGDGGNGEPGNDDEVNGEPGGDGDGGTDEPQLLQIIVIGELSHDPTAFTQGLEISDGRLYESTGAPDDRPSSIRELDRSTGEVLRVETIGDDLFAEGLTFVDGSILQLTWQDEVALVWDPEELSEIDRIDYEGQGWGLCFNGRVLVMSDGSAELHFRDPVTFERVGNPVAVTLEGEELPSLNELECVGDKVYANVWQTDLIVQIDPVTGQVRALADASDLGLPRPDDPNAVLNGIAWDPDTETFLITGKDWPVIYEMYFEAAGAPNNDPRATDP